jgi:hypothetical protein
MRFLVRSQENSGELNEIAGNAKECPFAIESWQRISIEETILQENDEQPTALDLPTTVNPWLAMAGIFDPNDPLIREWKAAMAEYRLEVELDLDRLC